MDFEIIGKIHDVEVIAVGPGIRIRQLLIKRYGRGRWRKLKGTAMVKLASGSIRTVELRWYQAHGIGKRDMKIKQFLDD